MAGHSQFKNIMHRKGKQDAKRGKLFTKIIREIMTAARSGLPDPAANPRLRAAVIAAREVNMPKDTIERAIKRGSGAEGGEAFEDMRYEGYGPGGVAVISQRVAVDHRVQSFGSGPFQCRFKDGVTAAPDLHFCHQDVLQAVAFDQRCP